MLYHSWKYLALIQDIFGITNNQFQYVDYAAKQQETFELDFAGGGDQILNENQFTGFHEAGPNVDKALNAWAKEYEKIGGAQAS